MAYNFSQMRTRNGAYVIKLVVIAIAENMTVWFEEMLICYQGKVAFSAQSMYLEKNSLSWQLHTCLLALLPTFFDSDVQSW